jgi:hypothetical protein
MRIIHEEITGNLIIESDSQYDVLNADTVNVGEYVTARLYGTIHKDLIIKKEAKVYLHGVVRGQVINEGGILYLFDTKGNLDTL